MLEIEKSLFQYISKHSSAQSFVLDLEFLLYHGYLSYVVIPCENK